MNWDLKNLWRFSMYPYNYPLQSFYPIRYWNLPNQFKYDYNYFNPFLHESEEEQEEEYYKERNNIDQSQEYLRNEGSVNAPIIEEYGKGNAAHFFPDTPIYPGMTSETKSGMPTQTPPINIAELLKQIEVEIPEIIKALTAIGMSIFTARELILRIIEAAQKSEK